LRAPIVDDGLLFGGGIISLLCALESLCDAGAAQQVFLLRKIRMMRDTMGRDPVCMHFRQNPMAREKTHVQIGQRLGSVGLFPAHD